jgi:hypothetical protein
MTTRSKLIAGIYKEIRNSTVTALGLRTPGIYSIPCECGRVYIGQNGRSVQLRTKENNKHTRLSQPDKSAVAEHSINHDNIINPLNAELNPICHLLALLGTHHILHFSRIQNSSPLKPDKWIGSSGKPLNLKCTHTISTEKIA